MNLQHVSPEKTLCSGLYIRKSNGFISLVTMLLLVLPTILTFGQSPEVRKAFRLIDIEQPSKGIAALEQLVSANPTNTNYLYYLGLAQLRTGAKDKAAKSFEKGLNTNEKDALNYAGKGYLKLLEKNPAEAKVLLDKALAISKSKDANVLKAVAEAYLTDTKYLLDAMNLLNKAKTINPTDPEIHLLLGDAYLIQNSQQGGEAVSSYERAAKADPKTAKPYYKIAKIFQRAKNNEEAIKYFTQGITIDPEYAPIYKELGELYYVTKQPDKAVEAYEKYLAITENPADAKFKLAFFYFMARKFDKADAIFREVTTNPNVSPIAWRYWAYSLTEQGKPTDQNKAGDPAKLEEARKAFGKYFEKAKPEDIQASDYAYFGNLQLYSKTPLGDSLANENFAKSLALDSAQLDVAQSQADTYFRRKKYPKAIDAYELLLKIRNPPSTADLFNLGRSYYQNLQFAQADSVFTKVTERAPQQTLGYQWAGRARQQIDSTGVQGLANPMYEQLIEKSLTNPEKYKKELIEAYMYFAAYYINIKKDVPKAKEYLEKILAIDPAHAQAKEALKVINEPAPKNPTKGGK